MPFVGQFFLCKFGLKFSFEFHFLLLAVGFFTSFCYHKLLLFVVIFWYLYQTFYVHWTVSKNMYTKNRKMYSSCWTLVTFGSSFDYHYYCYCYYIYYYDYRSVNIGLIFDQKKEKETNSLLSNFIKIRDENEKKKKKLSQTPLSSVSVEMWRGDWFGGWWGWGRMNDEGN